MQAGGIQSDSPQAIFTSFKLPKPTPTGIVPQHQSEPVDPRTPSPAREPNSRPSSQVLVRCMIIYYIYIRRKKPANLLFIKANSIICD